MNQNVIDQNDTTRDVTPDEVALIDRCQFKAEVMFKGRNQVNRREVLRFVIAERSAMGAMDTVDMEFCIAVAEHIVSQVNEGVMFDNETN